MAAALRTPSLKYRSFGNEPVRTPPAPSPRAEDQALSALGEALALVNELPPDAVLGDRAPALPPPVPTRDAYRPVRAPAATPEASACAGGLPAATLPDAPPREAAPLPLPSLSRAPAGPLPPAPIQAAPGSGGKTLLQLLLASSGGAAPVAPQARAPAGVPPVAFPALGRPIPARRPDTGSSLLDTLFAGKGGGEPVHYALIDALDEDGRGAPGESSARYWPAARVEIALPELLRRVAAGLRAASAA
ncbi:hypothetical protein EAH89_04505 [Roseomonas nepalensis]|uniref:Uncharacterized protein n=2 Tax=Muricoccus nepalensis TaxID=1854500 RepID=A0A502GDW1_9PROT|nr:hypothetical protein EAH89_04505 [Roseomonas nepalensis]